MSCDYGADASSLLEIAVALNLAFALIGGFRNYEIRRRSELVKRFERLLDASSDLKDSVRKKSENDIQYLQFSLDRQKIRSERHDKNAVITFVVIAMLSLLILYIQSFDIIIVCNYLLMIITPILILLPFFGSCVLAWKARKNFRLFDSKVSELSENLTK